MPPGTDRRHRAAAPTPANSRTGDARLQRVIELFEHLMPEDLPRLGQVYHRDIRFKDPFNEVQGLEGLTRVFEHMFATLDEARFEIREALVEGDQAFLTWDFHCRQRQRPGPGICIHGGSHLRFAPDGRVLLHRDYWDAAEELYEKLPMLGSLLRWLKARLAA